ncbi:MAG: AmmeMemoRadiSam system radical SAM enzyme [Nanoarchaeota archaeon]|nr:AmmeMemoRadiSam system radical SAM enzyme [Nanoarchaeota archaeon]
MKRALFYKKIKNKTLQCRLCPRFCILKENELGKCKVRKNMGGILYSLSYEQPVAMHIDPIEKKPLYHFLPGTTSFSIGMAGCNLCCTFCQNWEISQKGPEEIPVPNVRSKEIIKEALKNDCPSISYTYSEPLISYEYVLECSKLARKNKMKNVIVSNGFTNPEPLKKIIPFIDAVNIDVKGDDKFYREITGAWLEPVLESLKLYKKNGVWIEVTNLLIPGKNDSQKQIKWLVDWIAKNLGKDTPVHFSAFWPTHKLQDVPSTTLKTLKKAREIGMKKLNYVYTGNLPDEDGNNTYCPSCKEVLIKRMGFKVMENNIKNGKCKCGKKIAGVWV